MLLEGKSVVVTAAASGIGRAIALAMCKAGADLSICDIDASQLDEVAGAIRAAGRACLALTCDVGDRGQLDAFVQATLKQFKAADILVNNAGIGGGGSVTETGLDEWRRVMSVNLDAAFYLAHAFIPGMIKRKWGRVIQISSLGGKRPFAHAAPYSVSKIALIGLTRSIALDYAADGITANAICPSWTRTHMAERFADHLSESLHISQSEAYAQMAATLPQNRIVEPDEVAELAVMLASDAARGINGQAISVDQGASLS
jgi:NAD(P)-dependent dehydrogenase (short-subunit alcohol dehydrogenase family)